MTRKQFTFWLAVLLVIWSLGGTAQSQVVMRPVDVGHGPATFASGWYNLNPVRQAADTGSKSGTDIDSHMPAQNIYRDADPVTSAHEQTHGINSYIRQQCGGRCNAFYVLGNYCFVVREPNLRKSTVCQYVPAELRGDVWGLYMAGQSEWDDRPTYILDEWTAYINGAMVGRELGNVGSRSLEYDVRHCVEFAGYASALLVAVDQHDANYPDRELLQEFVAYNLKRTMKLTEPQIYAAQVQRFEAAYAPGVQCQSGQCGTLQWQSNVWVKPRPILGGTKTIVTQPKAVVATPAKPLVTVVPAATCNCSGELARLKSELAELNAKLDAVSKQPGPAGKDGRDGANGKDADPAAFVQKPFTVEIYSPTGKLLQSKVVQPGGKLPLQLYITKPTK